MPIPEGCTPAAELKFTPASGPLGQTVSALWKATVGPHPAKGTVDCQLELSDMGIPGFGNLTFSCFDGTTSPMVLRPGASLRDPAIQAALAWSFVSTKLAIECADFAPQRSKKK